MGALIDFAGRASSNLPNNLKNNLNKKMIASLKQKLETSIIKEKSLIVYISTHVIDCRNTFYIEDYEIAEDYLYLNNGSFEVHINFNEAEIKYDKMSDSYTFIYDDMEICLMVLQ